MKQSKMQSVRGAVSVRGAAKGGFAPTSVRNMFKASENIIVAKMNSSNGKFLDELLAEVMHEAAARGWGDDWKFVAPAWGGLKYYGIRNPIRKTRKKKVA
jgi:hypothetical protein